MLKKLILTSEQPAEHTFAGQNTQQKMFFKTMLAHAQPTVIQKLDSKSQKYFYQNYNKLDRYTKH